MGGFFTMLEYGVLFPLGGLGYQDEEAEDLRSARLSADTGAAQILRLYLGVIF